MFEKYIIIFPSEMLGDRILNLVPFVQKTFYTDPTQMFVGVAHHLKVCSLQDLWLSLFTFCCCLSLFVNIDHNVMEATCTMAT